MRGVGVALGAILLAAGCAAAQGGPPPPLPVEEVGFPPVHESTLSSGAHLVVVPWSEVPFVTVNVVVPGGTVADPAGREGTATFVARLLQRGTGSRSFDEIAGALDRRGISLAAAAAEEWTTISLNATTPALDEGLEILADILVDPSFPDDQVDLTRTQARTGLQVQSSRADAVADRAFTRRLYGDHPYGRLATTTSVSAVERQDLVDFHRRWYRPDGAVVVVAGDVDPERVARRLDAAFRGWEPGSKPDIDFPRAPDRTRPEVVVVHRPGAVQAEIRVGHLLMGGDVEGWEDLVVANQILGGGPPGRLQQVLRGALGYTYDARSAVTRQRRLGVFRIATAARTEVVGATVQEIFEQVERLRTRAIPGSELSDEVAFLVGSFPRSVETPQQVAGQLTEWRLIGAPADALESYRARIAAVDTARARAAAERWIRPEQFLVVVSGDAARLQPQLRALGEVRIIDTEGRPLGLSDLGVGPASEVFDLSHLTPDTLTYDVVVGGAVRGKATRILEPQDGGWRFASVIQAGFQTLEQELVVDDALEMVSSRNRMAAPTKEMQVETRREGDRITGRAIMDDGPRPVDLSVPRGVTLSDGLELALWGSRLAVGREIRLPVADVQEGVVETVVLRVEERTEISVPAGTFDVFRVSVSGRDPQTIYVRAQGPHVPIRMESASRPIALELASGG